MAKVTFIIDEDITHVRVEPGKLPKTGHFVDTAVVIHTKKDLKGFTMATYVNMYNLMTGKDVKDIKKFKNIEDAVDRVWAELQNQIPAELKGKTGKGRKKLDGLVTKAKDKTEHTKRGKAKLVFDAVYKAGYSGIQLSALREEMQKEHEIAASYTNLCIKDGVTQGWVTFDQVAEAEEEEDAAN
jgi:hypothetical protein